MGAEILEYIADGKTDHVARDLEFESDGLFCEGVFEVDLDRNVFETRIPGYGERESRVVSFPLDDLPTDDEYLDVAEPDED
jgi:hypothetical protein